MLGTRNLILQLSAFSLFSEGVFVYVCLSNFRKFASFSLRTRHFSDKKHQINKCSGT